MMSKERIGSLADGIFAIVMTILVLELRVPDLPETAGDIFLWQELIDLGPLFVAYAASFLVLSTYWIAHHYMMSLIVRNVNRTLTYLNIPFFMSVALIPFSTHLLGRYNQSALAIGIYGANIILVGLFLWFIRHYIVSSTAIATNPEFTERDFRIGLVRTVLPMAAALLAIVSSFWKPAVSLLIFIAAILFNLVPSTLRWLLKFFWKEERKPVGPTPPGQSAMLQ